MSTQSEVAPLCRCYKSYTSHQMVFTWSQLKVQGEGNTGPFDGINGDLLVLIEEKKHEELIRDGINLHYELYISISEAILGCKKEIPTINGKVQISIPSGIDNGKVLRLKAKGVPDINYPQNKNTRKITRKINYPQNCSNYSNYSNYRN